MAASSLRIVVTGIVAEHPFLGGVAWDYVQYAAGLKRLGHHVTYIEDSGSWPYNLDGGAGGNDWVQRDPTPNVEHLARVMRRFGLGESWAYRFPVDDRWFGLSDAARAAAIADADLLINVSGTLEFPARYRGRGRMIYIDSDPVFTQAKIARGDAEFAARVAAHDRHFSFGEKHSGHVPPTGYKWLPTRQPVLLDDWRVETPPGDAFTTVMSWTSYKPLTYGGRTFGQKDIEFRKFIELPGRCAPAVLEVALGPTRHSDWEDETATLPPAVADLVRTHPGWTPRDLLRATGWRVVDAIALTPDIDSYRGYIARSKAEWSVAKHGYVAGNAGWFSCRSACYLAAGRPVVVEDTGFPAVLPTGEGLFAFSTLDEAAAGIAAVEAHYPRHAAAARALAETYFDSGRVLTKLIADALAP
jgi:hypothetical protein